MNDQKLNIQPNIIAEINTAMQPTDLIIPQKLSLEEHQLWLSYFANIYDKSQWYIGALIIKGQAEYGEMYAQVIGETGLSYSTVANCASVYRKIESSRRRENLSWSHHEAVAKLEPQDQDKYLEKADSGKWTRQKLRTQLKEAGLIKSTKLKGKDIHSSSSETIIGTEIKEKIDNLLCEICKPNRDEIINLIG